MPPRHAGRHDGEGDYEGEEPDAEGELGVEGRACGAGVLADQFQVAQRGQERHDEGEEERQPERAADAGGDRPDEGVDAHAQDVADDEEQQQSRADDPSQARRRRVRLVGPHQPGTAGRRSAWAIGRSAQNA